MFKSMMHYVSMGCEQTNGTVIHSTASPPTFSSLRGASSSTPSKHTWISFYLYFSLIEDYNWRELPRFCFAFISFLNKFTEHFAAVEEGIVPGGGTALLRCIEKLDGVATQNEDQVGYYPI